MRGSRAHNAALWLGEAWETGRPLRELPAECRPRGIREAYAAQAALARNLGFARAGWKIGCTSQVAREHLGAHAPFAAPIFAARVYASGVTLARAAYHDLGLEGEFAFRLAKDIKPRQRRYSPEQVADAVAVALPAIEIIGPRWTDWLKVGLPSIIADIGGNGALVLGKPLRNWRRRDLAKARASMTANGKVVGQGAGADALGGPLLALAWLADQGRITGGLLAGEIVTTGTCTGIHYATAGERAAARVAGGTVLVSII